MTSAVKGKTSRPSRTHHPSIAPGVSIPRPGVDRPQRLSLGVFGGTFDPVHCGHLRAAEEVREALHLDRILFIPAGDPPHRARPGASAADRLAMVRKAAAGNPALGVSAMEVKRAGKSFTVDTLQALAARHPRHRLYLILGEDQFRDLGSWHQPARLFDHARMVVITRPGVEPSILRDVLAAAGLSRHRAAVARLPVSRLDISSTDIRERIRNHRSVRYLVPEAVRRHIRQRRLYQAPRLTKTPPRP